jgi:hypothetical protein
MYIEGEGERRGCRRLVTVAKKKNQNEKKKNQSELANKKNDWFFP